MVKGFSKMYNFAIKNSTSENLQFFFADSKVEHKSFPMMYHLSYFRGGGGVKLTPPVVFFT